MIDIRKQDIGDFLDEVAAGTAAPAGGAASALGGAMGAALLSMVARLTIGRKAYADVQEEMKQILARCEAIRQEMTNLAQLDGHVFERVMAAYRMPKKTEAQRSTRTAAIENTLMDATQVPLKVAVEASELFDHALILARKGNKNAASDAGAGLLLLDAAMRAALMNVDINISLLNDEAFKEGVRQRVQRLRQGRDELKALVLAEVERRL
jgi:formiminotetrahydrofolate cyclodeaminase